MEKKLLLLALKRIETKLNPTWRGEVSQWMKC